MERHESKTVPPPDVSDLESWRRWVEEQPTPPVSHEDLRGLLDHLEIERVYLLGLEDGGVAALNFSIEYPQRVGALVLVDTVIPSTGSPQQLEKTVGRGIQKAMEMQPVLEKALRERDPTALVDWALEDPSYSASTEATRRRLREIYSDNGYSMLLPRGLGTYMLDPPAGERLNEIEAPTLLIIAGERDPDLRGFDETLVAGIAKSKKVTIPDASRTLNMDRPEEFNRILTEFLGGL